jgi:hypothetical protein
MAVLHHVYTLMYIEVAINAEECSAHMAIVWPFSNVQDLMYLQDTLCFGEFLAYIAKVRPLSIFSLTVTQT